MEKSKKNIEISSKLYKDISSFCNLNDLKIDEYIEKLLKSSFLKDKYGEMPFEHEPKEDKIEKNIDIPTENFENKEKNIIFVDNVVKEENSEAEVKKYEEKKEDTTKTVEPKEENTSNYDVPKVKTTRKRRKLN